MANIGDDGLDRAGGEVVFQVGGVEALEQFALEALGAIAAASVMDDVLDAAQDALAGGGAGSRVGRGVLRGAANLSMSIMLRRMEAVRTS